MDLHLGAFVDNLIILSRYNYFSFNLFFNYAEKTGGGGSGGVEDMKSLSCRDLGGECDFIVYGQTSGEVMRYMLAHAQRDHADKLKDMTQEEIDGLKQRMVELLNKAA